MTNPTRLVHRGGLIFVCLLLVFASTVQAETHYVVPPGTAGAAPADPYTSWATAGTNIIDVVNAAMTNIGTRTVWVTNGEYCLTNEIMMTNIITVRNFSGNYSNTLVYAGWPTYTNRCFYVVNSGTVDGFTISNGHIWASNNYTGGGGAYVATGTIQNCYFLNNVCSNDGLSVGGGAIYIGSGGGTVVSNCVIYANRACGVEASTRAHGGGVYISGNSLIVNCSFISNNSSQAWGGGGLFSVGGTVSNCFFAFNTDHYHSGAYIQGGLMTDCIISNNVGGWDLGVIGVMIWSGCLRNSVIVNNRSSAATLGGGVRVYVGGIVSNCVIAGNSRQGVDIGDDSAVTIIGCQISNNINLGDARYSGAGINIRFGTTVKNCYIHNNTNLSSRGGGGIYLTNAAPNRPTGGVFNCTIVNNWSTNEGGGIAADGPSNYIANCIIANNTSYSNNYPNVYYGSSPGENSSNFYNSCVVTAAAGILAENQGNITNDPIFKDPVTGNYRLKSNSPCVNRGTNMNWMTNSFDLDGRIRIRYGRVDMGAYEAINEGTFYKFH